MKHLLTLITVVLVLASCTKDRTFTTPTGPTNPTGSTRAIIDYWNFNSSATTPTTTNVSGAGLSFDFATVSDTTGYDDLYTYATTTTPNINAQNGDPLGTALRVRNPVTDFIIAAPTTGYDSILVSYSEAKSSNGPGTNTVYYTLDGTNYIIYPGATATYTLQVDPAYTLETFDFTSITGANNNPHFKVKIVFSNGNMATSGNDRFDNLTIQGTAIGNTPPPGNAPVISSAATASGTVNTVFAGYTVTASNTPTSFALTGTPVPGLSFNTATGAITGTPTTAGTYVDTVKATNASGTGTKVLTITIAGTAAPVTLYYWNFNNITTLATAIAPTTSVNNNAGLSFDFTGAGYYDTVSVGPTQTGIADGEALRVRNPSVDFIMTIPTSGYKNIVLSYATDISSLTSGALTDSVYYSVDGGVNWINTGLNPVTYNPSVDVSSSGGTGFTLMTYDLSSITSVNNLSNFKFKVAFFDGNTGTKGNTRFDNITVTGIPQ